MGFLRETTERCALVIGAASALLSASEAHVGKKPGRLHHAFAAGGRGRAA
jgi:hypothetical protein